MPGMSRKKSPERFSFAAPRNTEAPREMPAALDIVEYVPNSAAAKKKMAGGAYNPYESSGADKGDTARMHKPRVDLRKLSEWIKTTQQVKNLREEDLSTGALPPAAAKPPTRK